MYNKAKKRKKSLERKSHTQVFKYAEWCCKAAFVKLWELHWLIQTVYGWYYELQSRSSILWNGTLTIIYNDTGSFEAEDFGILRISTEAEQYVFYCVIYYVQCNFST